MKTSGKFDLLILVEKHDHSWFLHITDLLSNSTRWGINMHRRENCTERIEAKRILKSSKYIYLLYVEIRGKKKQTVSPWSMVPTSYTQSLDQAKTMETAQSLYNIKEQRWMAENLWNTFVGWRK